MKLVKGLFPTLLMAIHLQAGGRPSPEMLSAMRFVESRNNPLAYNRRENAVGLFQVRQLAVDDINHKFRTTYTLADFYREPRLGEWAVWAYGSKYGARTDADFAMIWNGGPNGRRKKNAQLYWQKIQRRMRESRGH